jgi:hypothetical protein
MFRLKQRFRCSTIHNLPVAVETEVTKLRLGRKVLPGESMSADVIGQLPEGLPVYCDRHALAADHIFVVNRVRPHSALDGEVQRALWKVMLDQRRLLAGLMLVENGRSGTARIQAVPAEQFADAERKVSSYARSLLPRLPFRFIDILLVDEMGPKFGCHGVDLAVVGRKQSVQGATPEEFPQIRTLVFRDLNPSARGNALGVGHADLIRSRLLRKIDFTATGSAALAIKTPSPASIPMHFETDREILDAALSLTALQPPEKARMVWIRNTSSLGEFECSQPFLEEVMHWGDLSVASECRPLEFDVEGNLRDFVIGYAD